MGCGAPLSQAAELDKFARPKSWKSGPFTYKGYVCFAMHESMAMYDLESIQFWLGDRLVDTINAPRTLLDKFVKEGEDTLPFFYNLLKVSQGEEEVMHIEAMNKDRHAMFEIRRLPSEAEEFAYRVSSFDNRQIYEALKEFA
jgi:hypothetical protein